MKAVSDVIAPLSGEVLEVNQKAVDEPETINEDPYGEAGSCASGLDRRGRGDALLDRADGLQGRTSAEQWSASSIGGSPLCGSLRGS